ncbi:MAG: hypothetical protein WBG50_24045 [Desulfomonilaceae bacterium]
MKKLLSRFNLGDTYEIQARVLPAMLVVLPVAVLVGQVALIKSNVLAMIGWGAGLEVVLAIFVSKIGHALGSKLQGRLEKEWGGLPTHAWLRPSDQTHSTQQKQAWRKTVSKLSGLDIDKAVNENSAPETDRVIADAVMACRNKIRGKQKAALVQTYNMAFGFARNLAGMKWLALVLCLICFGASLYGSLFHEFELAGTVIQALFLVIAGFYAWIAESWLIRQVRTWSDVWRKS